MSTGEAAKPLYQVLAISDQQLYDDEHRPIPGRRVLWQMVDGAKFTTDFPEDDFSMEVVAKELDRKAIENAKILAITGDHVATDEHGRPMPLG